MASRLNDDIRELIEALSERLDLRVRNRSLLAGAGVGAVAAGLGMVFGPFGMVAGAAVRSTSMAWTNAGGEMSLLDFHKSLKEKLYTGVRMLLHGVACRGVDALLDMVLEKQS